MANLILKASSGNSLVVQGGDASPAITVGNTGTTTFAENATLSGTANDLGTVTAGTLNSTVATSGWNKVEIFKSSQDTVGTVAADNYIGTALSFTPSFNCSLLVGWGFSYRFAGSGGNHCYLEVHLLNSGGTSIEGLRTHGSGYAISATNHNQGAGGLENATTSLTGGTAYKIHIKAASGASLNIANDIGHDLKMTAICYS
jgi:hypothetical protein